MLERTIALQLILVVFFGAIGFGRRDRSLCAVRLWWCELFFSRSVVCAFCGTGSHSKVVRLWGYSLYTVHKEGHFFKSVVKPEGNWIEFSLEVAQFLSNNRVYRLNPQQFASLLFDNLTNKTIIMDLKRFDLTKVFEVYQAIWYSIKEAGRDFKRFERDPCTLFYHGLKISEYIHWKASSPKGCLLLGLNALTPYQLTALYNSDYTFSMSSGTLAIKDDEHDKVNELCNTILAVTSQERL